MELIKTKIENLIKETKQLRIDEGNIIYKN